MTMFDYNYFSSLKSSWERIKTAGLPVVIYGMGDGCLKVLQKFSEHGIECQGIFASDDFVRGHEFQGFKVKRYQDMCKELGQFVVVPAFGTQLPDVMQRFEKIATEQTLIMPDTPVFGDEYFDKDVFLSRFDDAKKVYDLLCDEQSKRTFAGVLQFKVTGDISCLKSVFSEPSEAYSDILKLGSGEVYLDLGAYTGDTILEFADFTNGQYKQIIGFEPNVKNYNKCVRETAALHDIELHQVAAWSSDGTINFAKKAGRQAHITDSGVPVECRSVDSVLNGRDCTFIKYDVEGADKEAIEGSVQTIRRCSPKICTALYHRAYDLIDIPLQLHEIKPDYKLYIRQYPYYPCWDMNLICI
ncbi:MAG: FkbM family methyltransferase [Ruminococcus sp.]|nr:FkbM family methyltransferase [Ruminococcus sp.]